MCVLMKHLNATHFKVMDWKFRRTLQTFELGLITDVRHAARPGYQWKLSHSIAVV